MYYFLFQTFFTMTETSNINPASGETGNNKSSDQITSGSNNSTSTERSKGREFLKGMLNKLMKVKLSDGRILIGVFLCTDKESNVILGSCAEYVVQQTSTQAQGTLHKLCNDYCKNSRVGRGVLFLSQYCRNVLSSSVYYYIISFNNQRLRYSNYE